MMGWSTCTPAFDAMDPVRNGNAADPACPRLAVNPAENRTETVAVSVVLFWSCLLLSEPLT